MTDSLPNQCPGCGRANGCALAAGDSASACWCMEKAVRLPLPGLKAKIDEAACYCERCLQRLTEHTTDAQR